LWLVLLPLWAEYRMSGTYFGYPRVPEEGAERDQGHPINDVRRDF
jgi:hypothetical protein